MDVLNNRELATIIWLTVLGVWSCTQTAIRHSLRNVVNVFFAKKIITWFAVMTLYVVITVLLLNQAALWNFHQLKNTLIWFLSTALVSFLNINSISKKPEYFKEIVKDNLKILVILEFLISFYTFNIWIELIIVPLVTLLAVMSSVSNLDKEVPNNAGKFISNLLAFSGVLLIVYAFIKLITDFGEFAKVQTLYDFLIPPLLTFLFLPFIFFMIILMSFESSFARLDILIKDPSLIHFAKFKSLTTFKLNPELLNRWVILLARRELKIETRDDLKSSMKEIKSMYLAEKYPKKIPLSDGWSPYVAKEFLIQEGIETGYYQPVSSDEWFACSPVKKLGQEILASRIEYFIDGNAQIADSLKLRLTINVSNSALADLQKFINIAKTLYVKALLNKMPTEIEDSILSGHNNVFQIGDKKISIIKSDWENGNRNGCDIKFVIEHCID